jgi:outer membrane lipoprotein SlyB
MTENIEGKSRIHPLVAGAAAAVIIASGVGVAAVTGYLPGSSAQKAEETPPAAPVKQAHSTAKPVHVAAAPSAAQAKPRCHDCGVVTDIKEVEVKGEGSGVGAVGGAVVGGVVAHEVFDGKNQGLATIAGAAGGALAGNAIEKNVKTKKHYDVALRMEDGSTRSVTYAAAPSWKSGDHVRVVDGKLQPAQ